MLFFNAMQFTNSGNYTAECSYSIKYCNILMSGISCYSEQGYHVAGAMGAGISCYSEPG